MLGQGSVHWFPYPSYITVYNTLHHSFDEYEIKFVEYGLLILTLYTFDIDL